MKEQLKMSNPALQIIKSTLFIAPVAFLTFLLASVIVYFIQIDDLVLFPNTTIYSYNYYTDGANGGNSEMLNYEVSDSLIHLKFQLNDAFYSPYVGLVLSPNNQKAINAAKYNQLSISVRGENMDRIGISLYTPPLNPEQNSDETPHHAFLNITETKTNYTIAASEFQFPDWWTDLHQLNDNENELPDLQNLLHINIGSAFTPQINKAKTIEIYQIAFTRNNRHLFLLLGSIYLGLLVLIFGICYLSKKQDDKKSEVIVSYQSLETSDGVAIHQKCLQFINANYHQSDLTLERIAEQTATTPRKITQIINDKFNCNFKTYLNRIRITEAKRLLKNTNLNMGEIAFKVGFNSQSHFNRVFKSETLKSPSEYRETGD